MRWIRLAFLSLLSFVLVTSDAFFKKSIAIFLCGVFSVSSAACYSWTQESDRAMALSPDSALTQTAQPLLPSSTPEPDSESIAQFRLPRIPVPNIPLPGGGSVEDVLRGAVADQVLRALRNVIEDEAPIVSSTRSIYPTVNELPGSPFNAAIQQPRDGQLMAAIPGTPKTSALTSSTSPALELAQLPRVRQRQQSPESGGTIQPTQPILEGRYPFNPTGNVSQVVAQLQSSTDGSVRLEPGDYSIPMTLFCMKQRASSPDGHRYLLAPLKGKRADVIAALNAKAAGSGLPYQALQVLSWNIQAGMDYEEMPSESQALVNQLIPEQRQRLSRSFLEEVEATYNQFSGVAGLPSLDNALNQLGDVGRIIQGYREFRNTLIQYRNNYQALMRELIPPGASSAIGGAAYTPWSVIESDRVYARMITEGNAGDTGELQIRVLPPTDKSQSPTLAVGITNIVADSQNDRVQPLTGSPKSDGESPLCDTSKPLAKLPENQHRRFQELYADLLGILSKLDEYSQEFLNDENVNFMGLFPTAYHNTTQVELERIRNGDFQHPIEKMEQMIAFFEAYEVNRRNWDTTGGASYVEPHWAEHFSMAERATEEYRSCSIGCDVPYLLSVNRVLNSGVDAHVAHDLARALRDSLRNRTPEEKNQLHRDFADTRQTLEKSSARTAKEIFMFPGTAQQIDSIFSRTLEKVLNRREQAWQEAVGTGVLQPSKVGDVTIDKLEQAQPHLPQHERDNLRNQGKKLCQEETGDYYPPSP